MLNEWIITIVATILISQLILLPDSHFKEQKGRHPLWHYLIILKPGRSEEGTVREHPRASFGQSPGLALKGWGGSAALGWCPKTLVWPDGHQGEGKRAAVPWWSWTQASFRVLTCHRGVWGASVP